jgi:hypothetical protein
MKDSENLGTALFVYSLIKGPFLKEKSEKELRIIDIKISEYLP